MREQFEWCWLSKRKWIDHRGGGGKGNVVGTVQKCRSLRENSEKMSKKEFKNQGSISLLLCIAENCWGGGLFCCFCFLSHIFCIFFFVSMWFLCLLYFLILAASSLLDYKTGFTHFLNKGISFLPVLMLYCSGFLVIIVIALNFVHLVFNFYEIQLLLFLVPGLESQ